MSRIKKVLLIFMVSMFLMPVAFCEEQIVRIGVLKNMSDEKKNWQPTAEYLTQKIPQYKFEIVPLGFEAAEQAVRNMKVDFVLCNPELYTNFEKNYNASRIATIKNRCLNSTTSVFGGVIFTRADNEEIYTIKDLVGKRFSAVDKTSFGGWMAAWREIKLQGIDPYKDFKQLNFAGKQDLVVFEVLDKKADAGTVRTDVLERMAEAGRIKTTDLRIIKTDGYINTSAFPFQVSTRLYPEWPMAKLYHTDENLATQVAVVLLEMPQGHPAALAAGYSGWSYPLSYQSVRDLQMDLEIGVYSEFTHLTFKDFVFEYKGEVLLGLLLIFVMCGTIVGVTILNKRLLDARKISKLNEARLIQAQALAQVGNWEINLGEKLVWGSEEAFRICGIQRTSEYIPLNLIKDCLHPDELSRLEESFGDFWHENKPYNEECRILRADDRNVRYLQIQANFVCDDNGNRTKIMGVVQDITERKMAENLLHESEERFRLIFKCAPFPFVITDVEDSRVLSVNQRASELFGVPQELAIGRSGFDYYEDPLLGRTLLLEEISKKGFARDLEIRFKRENGEGFWALVSAVAAADSKGKVLLVGINDISERKKLEEEMKYKATFDGLTGIYNRMHFLDLAEKEWQKAATAEQDFAFLTIDIDYFKSINDTWGHHAGDIVLQKLAETIAAALGKKDIFGRVGGEEFAAILPATDLEEAIKKAENIRLLVEKTAINVNSDKINFTVSIGVAGKNDYDDELDSIYKRSDKALYRAKKAGRNTVAVC